MSLLPFHGRPACADADPDMFFPQVGSQGNGALRVCLELCPARRLRQCASWALQQSAFNAMGACGIVGGLTPNDRRAWHRGDATVTELHDANRTHIGLDQEDAA